MMSDDDETKKGQISISAPSAARIQCQLCHKIIALFCQQSVGRSTAF